MKAGVAIRRRRTPAVWLALAALVAGAAALERVGPRDAHDDGHGHGHGAGPRPLVSAPIAGLAAAEIVFDGARWRFERDGSGVWSRGEAGDAEASARIAAAFGVLGRAQTVRQLSEARDPEIYGVSEPFLSLALWTREADAPARYLFGDMAPDGLNRYVLAPRAEDEPEHGADGHSGHDHSDRHSDREMGLGPEMVTVPEYHTANLVGLVRSFEPR